jgi:hypothetical protein
MNAEMITVGMPKPTQNDEHRRDGDDRDGLKEHRVGIKHPLDPRDDETRWR